MDGMSFSGMTSLMSDLHPVFTDAAKMDLWIEAVDDFVMYSVIGSKQKFAEQTWGNWKEYKHQLKETYGTETD